MYVFLYTIESKSYNLLIYVGDWIKINGTIGSVIFILTLFCQFPPFTLIGEYLCTYIYFLDCFLYLLIFLRLKYTVNEGINHPDSYSVRWVNCWIRYLDNLFLHRKVQKWPDYQGVADLPLGIVKREHGFEICSVVALNKKIQHFR